MIFLKNILYENKLKSFEITRQSILSPFPHLHKELEFVYIKEGSALAWSDRKSYYLKTGDLFLCFPNQIHYYEFSQQGDYYVIIPKPDIFFGIKNMLYDNVPAPNPAVLKVDDDVVTLIEKVYSIYYSSRKYKDTEIIGVLNLILGAVLPYFNLKPRIKTDNSTLKSVLNYCNENFTDDITLDDISEKLHLSKYHISHLFNEKLNVGFNTYINMLRINLACELLEDTDKRIADISEEVGFGSIRTFNRAFSNVMKETPKRYKTRTTK